MIGIYKITNMDNGKMYIGSSNNIDRRWKEHKRMLNKGTHHSIKLQRAWNKYGEESFKFEVLEECDAEKLLYLEQFYIDKYGVYFEGYNCKESTKGMVTAVEYERGKLFEKIHNYLTAYTDISFLNFSDKKTNDRILLNKYKDNEHIWYMDILVFIRNIIKKCEFCEIKNNRKADEMNCIQFDITRGQLEFTVFTEDDDLIFSFKYILGSRKIYLTYCYDGDWNRIYDSELNNDLLGVMYDMSNVDINANSTFTLPYIKYTDEFFMLYTLDVFPYFEKERYINNYKNLPVFQEKLKDFLKINFTIWNTCVKKRGLKAAIKDRSQTIEECLGKGVI